MVQSFFAEHAGAACARNRGDIAPHMEAPPSPARKFRRVLIRLPLCVSFRVKVSSKFLSRDGSNTQCLLRGLVQSLFIRARMGLLFHARVPGTMALASRLNSDGR